jgi:hypothetical protein
MLTLRYDTTLVLHQVLLRQATHCVVRRAVHYLRARTYCLFVLRHFIVYVDFLYAQSLGYVGIT